MRRLVVIVIVVLAVLWVLHRRNVPAPEPVVAPPAVADVSGAATPAHTNFIKRPIDRANEVADQVRKQAQAADQPEQP